MIYLKHHQSQIADYKYTSTSLSVRFALKMPFRNELNNKCRCRGEGYCLINFAVTGLPVVFKIKQYSPEGRFVREIG